MTNYWAIHPAGKKLSERIAELNLPFPLRIEGFSDDIPHFMQLADYFVGKPGPGSISEALVMGLPVVVERNSWTMVQERFNTDWIVENQLGVVLHSFAEVAAGILPMLDADRLASFREHVRAINNRAIFEIPEILARLLASRPPQQAPARGTGQSFPRPVAMHSCQSGSRRVSPG